jgi:hypothetical protein
MSNNFPFHIYCIGPEVLIQQTYVLRLAVRDVYGTREKTCNSFCVAHDQPLDG